MFNTTAECIIDSLMKKDKVICNEKDLQLGTEYIFPKSGVPVSYTHLDVYKRQGYG